MVDPKFYEIKVSDVKDNLVEFLKYCNELKRNIEIIESEVKTKYRLVKKNNKTNLDYISDVLYEKYHNQCIEEWKQNLIVLREREQEVIEVFKKQYNNI